MKASIALEIFGAVSGEGFSLDELVTKTRQLFQEEGLPGFLRVLLELIDESLCLGIVQGVGPWQPPACCTDPHYELHGRLERRFRSSVGEVKLRWRRLHCRCCGRTLVPLRLFLGMSRWASPTGELERIVTEVVSEQSYRRSTEHLRTIGEIPVPKSTLHRWVMTSPCSQLESSTESFDFLLADGTGFKRAHHLGAKAGELRMAVGVTAAGQTVPLGAWSGLSWEKIGVAIHKRVKEAKFLAAMESTDWQKA